MASPHWGRKGSQINSRLGKEAVLEAVEVREPGGNPDTCHSCGECGLNLFVNTGDTAPGSTLSYLRIFYPNSK